MAAEAPPFAKALALLLALLLSSPAVAQEKVFRAALITNAQSNEFFREVVRGAMDGAEANGLALEVLSPAGKTSVAEQIDEIRDVTARKIDALVITPAASKAIVAPLLAAQRAGIAIVVVDNPLDPREVMRQGMAPVPLITADNQDGARRVIVAALEQFPPNDQPIHAAIIEGIRGADNAEARRRGAQIALAQDPRVRVLASEPADWERLPAVDVTRSLVQRYPDLDLIFCANDDMALGALDALRALGNQHVRVVGYDDRAEALEAVRAGRMFATVDQLAARQGWLGMETAARILRGQPVALETLLDVRLVVRSNGNVTGGEGSEQN